jgi:hypothetical protein
MREVAKKAEAGSSTPIPVMATGGRARSSRESSIRVDVEMGEGGYGSEEVVVDEDPEAERKEGSSDGAVCSGRR